MRSVFRSLPVPSLFALAIIVAFVGSRDVADAARIHADAAPLTPIMNPHDGFLDESPPIEGDVGAYQAPTPVVTPTPAPSPTPTPEPALGSISGQVYVDVNGNRAFDAWDAPYKAAPLGLEGWPPEVFTHYDYTKSDDDGVFLFSGVPAGDYLIQHDFGIPAGCSSLPAYTWTGEPETRSTCYQFPNFPNLPIEVSLSEGEVLEGIDVIGEPIREMRGTIWIDAAPLGPDQGLALGAGGKECWPAKVETTASEAGVQITHYNIQLTDFTDDGCIGGDVQLLIDGARVGPSRDWSTFWSRQIWPDYVEGVENVFGEVFDPAFMALGGSVFDPNDFEDPGYLPWKGSPVADDMLVTAVIGSTICAQTIAHAVYSPGGRQGDPLLEGNAFGLVVPPTSHTPGCGNPGAAITLCVGNKTASIEATGSWPRAQYYLQPQEDSQNPPVLIWQANQIRRFAAVPTEEPCPAPVALPSTGAPWRMGDHVEETAAVVAGVLLAAAGCAALWLGAGRGRLRPH
jgi:hypothetical protein